MAVVITNDGVKIFLDRALNTTPNLTAINQCWIGIGQTTPAVGATELTRTVPIQHSTTETVDDCEAADWTEGTDSIAETLNSTSFIRGSNSLNLGKSGTTGTTFSYTKSTTSRDFTSKTLYMFLYVNALSDFAASGTVAEVRLGSAAGDYYYKQFVIGDLSTGWNTLWMEQSTAKTTGTPIVAACDTSGIFLTTDADEIVTLGDVRMDHWHVASSDDYPAPLETGYPTTPGADLSSELRSLITDTEANGFQINGAAWKNTDSTPLVGMLGSFVTIGKDDAEQLVIVAKFRGRQNFSTS